MTDEYTLPSGSSRPGLSSAKALPPIERTLTGILSFDDVEGSCAFLLALDGTRHEVIYPAGWSVDRVAGELRGPAGEVVPAGATVTVTGAVARDRASICQIGPIFVATTVHP